MITKTCKNCGAHFKIYPSRLVAPHHGQFCSNECRKANTRITNSIPLTAEEARETFSYFPEDGELRWAKIPPILATRIGVGDIAGHVTDKGYRRVTIRDNMFYVHRVIWLYVTGLWPKEQIDHIDLNKLNNKWENLREATGSQNQANRKTLRASKVGLKGVCKKIWPGGTCKFISQISKDGKVHYLGAFDTPEEAHKAYCDHAKKFHGDFANNG